MIVHDLDQRSPKWYALRLGLPTSSEFSKLVTSKGEPSKSLKDYATKLAGELYAGISIDDFQSGYMERGAELEAEARAFYAFEQGVDVREVGFVTDDKKRMGCSPDGLVGSVGCLEIKCLKAENHIKAILRYQKDGTCPPDYVPQTQGQIFIADRQWCDLLFYHPALPALVVRQHPKEGFAEALTDAVSAVIAERDRVHAELCAFAPKVTERDELMAMGV